MSESTSPTPPPPPPPLPLSESHADSQDLSDPRPDRKSRPNFGCLGCFWAFGLLVFTVLAAGAIWWLNPMWFDRMAVWRGPVLSDRPVFVAVEVEDMGLDARAQHRARIEQGIDRWNEVAVETRYSPQTGAMLQTIEGTMFQFAPGALKGETKITAIPVMHVPAEIVPDDGHLQPIGPLHDVRVGGAAHTVFGVPVRVRVPIDFEALPPGVKPRDVRIGSYSNGTWETVSSRLDMSGGFVEGEISHASLIGGVAIGTGLTALAGKFTETGRSIRRIIAERNTYAKNVYDTDNFSIYYGDGGHVMQDDEYPLKGGRASGDVPLYVRDVGAWLEDARSNLGVVKMNVGRGSPHRWGVFLAPLDNFGSTDLGGPIVLDNDMLGPDEGTHPPDIAYRIRNTVVHELLHVAQDEFFNASNAAGQEWWLESTAEYLSNRYLRLRNVPVGDSRYYVRNDFRLLETPLDEASAERPYAYATFYEHLEKSGADVIGAIRRANEMGAPRMANVSRAFGENLGDGFVRFAKDYYHSNLWQDRYATPRTIAEDLGRVEVFSHLTVERGNAVRVYGYAERQLPMTHFTAQYINFHAPRLPEDIDAKLVIHFPHAAGNAVAQEAFVSPIHQPRTFPLIGQPTELHLLNISAADQRYVVDITESSKTDPTKASHVSLLVINHAASRDGPPLTVRRWLLLPPESGSFKRLDNGHYELTWQDAVLARQDRKGDAFKGYNVYRRKTTEGEFAKTPLNGDAPLTVTTWTDESVPDDDASYEYGITVVDHLDNESDHRVLDNDDPFEGVWRGKVVLVRGAFADPLERWIDKEHEEDRREIEERVAAAGDAEERRRIEARWDEDERDFQKTKAEVMELVDTVEELARLGIPATFRVTLREGKYYMRLERFVGMDIEATDAEATEMRRSGHALTTVEQLEDVPPLILRLHREDEINSLWEWSVETEIGRLNYGIRFHLERE